MNLVDLSTTSLAFVDRGDGVPVLLVHGFPLDHTMWDAQIEALAGSCRVIAPDLRGFGRSPLGNINVERGVSMEQYAEDLAELLEALAVVESIVLVGFSMGGYVAWQFMRKHPERVRALVQCDTRSAADSDDARAARIKIAESVANTGSGPVADAMLPKLLSPRTLESGAPVVARVRAMIERTGPAAIAAAQRGMAARPDVSELLPKISVPTLVLCGEQDAISPPREMQAIAEAIPNAEFLVIPGVGHMTTMENPQAVNDALVRFVEGVGRKS